MPTQLRRLLPTDAAAFQALRLQALRECPSAFGSSYEEECDTPLATIESNLARGSGRNLFGAFAGDELVGLISAGRESQRKQQHKGYIRGVYVAPAQRAQGLGRRLLEHALAFVQGIEGLRQVNLSVTGSNAGAITLYASLGFETYGHERDSLLIDGQLYDDVLMVRRLPPR